MLWLGLMVTLLVVGLGILFSLPEELHSAQVAVSSFASCGLFWITALLLPPIASSTTAALCVFIFVFTRIVQGRKTGVFPLIMGLATGALAYHFTQALLDVAMSSSEPGSDRVFLLTVLERSVSTVALIPFAILITLVVASALLAQMFGTAFRSRRS